MSEEYYNGLPIPSSVLSKIKDLENLVIRDNMKLDNLRDELDRQMQYIKWLEEFAPKAGEYNTSWDAYELAKGIHWTQMEEEE